MNCCADEYGASCQLGGLKQHNQSGFFYIEALNRLVLFLAADNNKFKYPSVG